MSYILLHQGQACSYNFGVLMTTDFKISPREHAPGRDEDEA